MRQVACQCGAYFAGWQGGDPEGIFNKAHALVARPVDARLRPCLA